MKNKKIYRMTLDVICSEEEIIGVKEQIGEIADVKVRSVAEVGSISDRKAPEEHVISRCREFMKERGYGAGEYNIRKTDKPDIYAINLGDAKFAVYSSKADICMEV